MVTAINTCVQINTRMTNQTSGFWYDYNYIAGGLND